MLLFNFAIIFFYLTNPQPHNSYLSHLGSLSSPAPSIGLYANDLKGIELGVGPRLSIGKFGTPGAAGDGSTNAYIKIMLPKGIYIGSHIANQTNENERYSLTYYGGTVGKYFQFMDYDFRASLMISYMYYYELHDKYTFTNYNIELLKPFRKGSYFQPFLAIQAEIGYAAYPENISSEPLLRYSPKFGAGINVHFRFFNSCLSLYGNRGNLTAALSLSFLIL